MELSAISNGTIAQMSTEMKLEENKASSFAQVLDKAVADKDKVALRKACVEFEGYFTQLMFKEMRKTVHSEQGAIKKSHAENVFQEMLDEEYSKASANGAGIGFADMMYKQLSRGNV